jgi:hypothetical protein
MSFNAIYGKGNTPQQALVYAKVNEIGHNTNPRFLKKTNAMCINYKNTNRLQEQLFTCYNIKDREDQRLAFTTSELNSKKELLDYYGKDKLNEILTLYENINSDISLCFIITKSNDYNLYKFLY